MHFFFAASLRGIQEHVATNPLSYLGARDDVLPIVAEGDVQDLVGVAAQGLDLGVGYPVGHPDVLRPPVGGAGSHVRAGTVGRQPEVPAEVMPP